MRNEFDANQALAATRAAWAQPSRSGYHHRPQGIMRRLYAAFFGLFA